MQAEMLKMRLDGIGVNGAGSESSDPTAAAAQSDAP